MIGTLTHLLTAFGLATASGLNAYIPLLIVALLGRFTGLVKLNPPFDILTNGLVIMALVVLLAIEVVIDKIPAADSLNDVIQTFIRPAAGALLFAANTNMITNLDPVIAAILGLVLAFGVHATKATTRPVVTATTGGIGNMFVSVAEDIVATIVSLLAVFVPFLVGIVLVLMAVWIVRRFFFRKRPARV